MFVNVARASRAFWVGAAALYTLLALLYLRPIWRVGGDHLAPHLEDPLFNLVVLKWGAHQIREGLPDVWNANFFHPTPGVLALSDHLLGPAAQLALFTAAVPNAIAGYNFLLFTSFVGSALATCWVVRRAGLSWTAALLAGGIFAFSPFRWMQMSHLQILIAQWIPLTLWFWDRLLAERTAKNGALFLLFYLLNLSGGCYLAYMIHFPLLALALNRAALNWREIVTPRSLRVLAPAVLIAAGSSVALFHPYVDVSRRLELSRSETEIDTYGAALASYLSPSERRPEKQLFAGFLPTALFLMGLAGLRRSGAWEKGLAGAGLLCFALSFPLVYAPLMRVIPGLSGMRVPARFYVFVSFALAFFAARGVDLLRDRLRAPRARLALAGAFAIVLMVELAPAKPLTWARLPREEEFPEVYSWIAANPEVKALIELPLREDRREAAAMYFSTLHWKPIANGYSGYRPPSHVELAQRMRFLPDRQGIGLLRDLWITHVVVHARKAPRAEALRRWERDFATGPEREVELAARFGAVSVYRVLEARVLEAPPVSPPALAVQTGPDGGSRPAASTLPTSH